MCRLGSIDTPPSTCITYIYAWACPRLSPRSWYFPPASALPGDLRGKLSDLIKLSWRVAVHLSLVVCVQGDPTNPWMTKKRMVGAISDFQLWCLRLPIELGQPPRLCMVMHVLRKIFML